jgi:hypothetical protein
MSPPKRRAKPWVVQVTSLAPGDQRTVEEDLNELNLVGVDHSGESPYPASTVGNDYDEKRTAKGEINSLNKMVRDPGRVVINYGTFKGEVIVGHIVEDEGMHVVVYEDSERVAHKEVAPETRVKNSDFDDVDLTDDDILPVKAIRYDPVEVVQTENHPKLGESLPRSSACESDALNGLVQPLIDGTEPDASVETLTRIQKEVLSEEWLRRTGEAPFEEFANTVKPGGETETVENIAMTEAGEVVLTQVTEAKSAAKVQNKAEALREYGIEHDDTGNPIDGSLDGKHLFLFAMEDEVQSVQDAVPAVKFVSIERVYEECLDWDATRAMIERMHE